ncbi:BZ3500_MvSof-1268-A1-R1_Chr1-3g01851 [Microbotryum saponariae]|uniref:Diphthamide biosynthesis protein 3 n=1 Tax=Microbotryum saponariae TaxID=289078 RepID=A0A2X0MED5_9BASI|nr:BZ3500_MvSof-1268-A1-R1_Chr1-3g01851 [Microbotryum saponariae]SCZ94740.1 BZ3501_MvSof-1269-A2-R1_Chr1-3g01453 [Microbotryum saponariae]
MRSPHFATQHVSTTFQAVTFTHLALISFVRCFVSAVEMVSYYDELEIEDFAWDDAKKVSPSPAVRSCGQNVRTYTSLVNEAQVFHYPCPCGDRFEITRAQLSTGEDVATCPSCSLIVRVVYDMMDYEDYSGDEEV